MCNKIFLVVLLTTFFYAYTTSASSQKISDELYGIKLGTKYNTIAKNYKFSKVKIGSGIEKVYKIVYLENLDLETYFYFFKSKVYKIKLVYGKNFADETDWENIYNQTKFNYGEYLSEVKYVNDNCIETYIWQDENVKQILEKISKNNVLETFSISIVDKKVETEILKMSPWQKFLQKIFSIF